ncbi:hypothetical protein Tco_0116732 [Tanacetum coccineum]
MSVIGSDFMQESLEVVERLKEEIRIKENNSKKILKIIKYLDTEDLEPPHGNKLSESLVKKPSFFDPKLFLPKSPYVRYVGSIFSSPPLVRESTFGFKPGKKAHKIPHKSSHHLREVPSFDELEPQPNPLANCPSLDISDDIK